MKTEEKKAMCMFFIAYSMLVSLITLVLSIIGLETFIFGVSLVMLLETVISVAFLFDSDERAVKWFWIGFSIHFLGFLVLWITSSAIGWWGKPFEWECEHGHGIFTDEMSPAYLWKVLAIMAAVRCIVLQPLYLIIYKIRRR